MRGSIQITWSDLSVGQEFDAVVLLAACTAEDHGEGDPCSPSLRTDRAGDLAGIVKVGAVAGEATLDLSPLGEVHVHLGDEPFLEGIPNRHLAEHPCNERSLDLPGRFFVCGILPDGRAIYADQVGNTLWFVGKLILDELDSLLRPEGLPEVGSGGVLDPDWLPGEMFGEFLQVFPAGIPHPEQVVADENPVGKLALRATGREEECLFDDRGAVERLPEEFCGERCDGLSCPLIFSLPHGRAGPDAPERAGGSGVLLQPPNEVCGIGALLPGVGVDLVEDEVLEDAEVLRREEDLVLEPGEDVLEHDIVGDQDVRRGSLDLLP